jgi:hypothetical protein
VHMGVDEQAACERRGTEAETGCGTKLSLRRGAAGTNAAAPAPPPHHPRPLALDSPHTRHTIIDATTKAILWMIMPHLLQLNVSCRADRASSRPPVCHRHH